MCGELADQATGVVSSNVKQAQSLKLGAAAQTLPIVFGYGSNLLATPFVVASLGLTNFGLWALTGAVAQYGVLLDLGVSRAIVRYVAFYHAQEDRDRERAVIGGCVMVIAFIGLFLTLPVLLFPSQLSDLIRAHDTALARTLFLSSIAVLITGILGAIMAGASIGRGRMVAANVGVSIQRAAVVVGGVIALVINPSLTNFAIGSAAGSAIGLVVVLIAILFDEHELIIGLPRKTVMRELIGFGLKGQAMAVSEIVMFQSGKLLAGLIIGPAAAGAYELGSRLALGARAVGAGASTVLGAHLTRAFAVDGAEEVRRHYGRLVVRNASVSNFPLLLLTATSFSVVPLWLNVDNTEVVWVVLALTAAYTVNVSTSVTIAAAFAFNQLGIVTIAAVAGSILAVALELPLAFIGGLHGILIGMVIAIIISSLFGVFLFHRKNDMPLTEFVSPLIGPFAVGIVSTLVAMPIGIFANSTGRASAIVPFLCSAAVFCAVYMTLGWRFNYLPTVNVLGRWRNKRAVPTVEDA